MADQNKDEFAALLRQLGAENPFDRQEAVERLRGHPVAVLVELKAHAVPAVRAGLAQSLAGRNEPELLAVMLELAGDADYQVRVSVAQALKRSTEWSVSDELLMRLAKDSSDEVALPAIERMGGRASCTSLLVKLGRDDDASWGIQRESNRLVASLENESNAIRLTLETLSSTNIEMIAREAAGHLEKRLSERTGELPEGALPSHETLAKTARVARAWSDIEIPKLIALLDASAPVLPDLAGLAEFGQVMSDAAKDGTLPRAFHVGGTVEALERALEGPGARSAVLIGPSGSGKTAAVNELCHRLQTRDGAPWALVRVQPAELLVGTKYLGEWQTRVRKLIDLVAAPQRVIVFFPGIAELPHVGLSSDNDQMSAATLLAPEIESGRIAVLGESTADAWTRGMGGADSLQRLFQRVDVRPLEREESRKVLELVALDSGAKVQPAALDVTMDVADVYLSDTALPGRAIDLLRRMIADSDTETFGRGDVLQTLQEATGVPPDFLDDSIPLRLDAIRDFFEARVMGQSRALEHVIDLVTLIKAGLDAPTKPSGVMLFVGPTGVGKTELSRALAELLFGDPGRLVRFDMSEYASYESYERLIGSAKTAGTLTEAVRRQPFSVVLFDEIEKAHANVFDLCLQIFDAGRLTDGSGRTVNFRKSIVIMTSNLGSAVQTDAGIGFDASTPRPPGDDEIQRAIGQFFRPEFLGRIDHVVRFDALSAETADRIARREVESVLARGGLTRRKVSVDVDASVYAHILRAGYSPALGARPLKRTVETLLLMPVARVLAAGQSGPGACIQLRVEGGEIKANLLHPDADAALEEDTAPAPKIGEELRRVEELRARAGVLDERRSELLERTSAPGFWDDAAGAAVTLDDMHRLESVLEDLDRLEAELEVTAANKNPKRALRYLERHAHAARRLDRLFAADDLGDAYVRLTGVRSSESELDGVERLARMYTAWARRERMDCRVLDDRRLAPESENTITLLIEGTGAHVLLSGEAGLHKLRHERSASESVSSLVRVDVLSVKGTARARLAREMEIETRPLRAVPGRLVTSLLTEVSLMHSPTLTSLRAWSPEAREAAPTHLLGLLGALIEAEPLTNIDIVRRYRYGRSPVVKDTRTGRSSGRVDRVFGGELSLVSDA